MQHIDRRGGDGAGKSRLEPLSAKQFYFRPALFWQPLFDEHVADAGLAFRLDVSTGGQCMAATALFPWLAESMWLGAEGNI